MSKLLTIAEEINGLALTVVKQISTYLPMRPTAHFKNILISNGTLCNTLPTKVLQIDEFSVKAVQDFAESSICPLSQLLPT